MTDPNDLLTEMLKAIGCQSGPTFIEILGEPRSKCRPRFTKNGNRVYNDKKQIDNEKMLKWNFKLKFKTPVSHEVAVACIFYRSTKSRIDLDNLTKQVLDAANGICWLDDMQVTGIAGILRLDRDNPRIVLAIADNQNNSIPGAMGRGTETVASNCEFCFKEFRWRPYPNGSQNGKFCSGECQRESILLPNRFCGHCEQMFKPRYSGQRACGDKCRLALLHLNNRHKPRKVRDVPA